ncbi:MAG: acyl-CoA dehydrogenase family protein [Sphingomonadales bacterium]|nr:acyl-CoA dehydrogenase family protein [Sphingomonadales bacterium]
MDFELSEEQLAVRGLAEQVLATRIPQAGQMADESWPDENLWSDLTQTGLVGLTFPESVGGGSLGFVEMCLLLEECGRARARTPLRDHLLAAMVIDRFGPDTLRQAVLPGAASGEMLLTAATADRYGGDGPPGLSAMVSAGGGYLLTGSQRLVSWGATAKRIVVFATLNQQNDTICLLLDPETEGVKLEPLATTDGAPEADLVCDGVQIGPGSVIAGPNQGGLARQWLWERLVVATCAQLAGLSATALRLTAEYTSTREQFGRPIGTFQAVAMHAADAFIEVEGIRLAMLQAAWRLGAGLDASREVSIAKLAASEGAINVVAIANHLHGGVGLLKDYPLQQYLTTTRRLALAAGSAQWHLARLGDIVAERAALEIAA